jgi:hypothetical protein
LKSLDKPINDLSKRLDTIELQQTIGETDAEIESGFAKLRLERIEKWEKLGRRPTFEEEIKEITQEEWDYYKRKNLEIPPEQRYQDKKEHWYFHESSWSMRGLNAYDGKGCNQFSGCIPECKFYAEEGRIEDEEVISWYENTRNSSSNAT